MKLNNLKEELKLLDEAMALLDDYLNAGDKEKRQKASVKAKKLYKTYYGVDYVNKNERNPIKSIRIEYPESKAKQTSEKLYEYINKHDLQTLDFDEDGNFKKQNK